MTPAPELLGLYWTVSGPVVVHFGREWSYFSWADRCAEARKVGFAGSASGTPISSTSSRPRRSRT